ncbi:hypothetical protein F5Y12DRAFT_161861 [Xylaria sp. FL1777]|nr:hypothetical protein F5Y12DRAFT_161861 [Xylaria sp. FL1777]
MSDESVMAENEAAEKIIAKIEYMHLAMNQAASLILDDRCSMSQFLEAYGLRELISDCKGVRFVSGETTYKYSVRTVCNMSYDRLIRDHQKLVMLMSFVDPDRGCCAGKMAAWDCIDARGIQGAILRLVIVKKMTGNIGKMKR